MKAKQVSGHWDELMAACKTSNNELKKAVESKSACSKKAAKGKAKSKAKAAGKPKAKPMYRIFDIEQGPLITEYTANPLDQEHDMEEPFILKKDGQPPFFKSLVAMEVKDGNDDAVKEIKEFKGLFSKSDLRFTAGKAQSPFSSKTVRDAMHKDMATILEHFTSVPLDSQPPSCFGCIGKHRSVQFEVGGAACFRLSLTGERS